MFQIPLGSTLRTYDDALNDSSDHKGDRGQEDLPSHSTKPACSVTEDLLVFGRRKLAHPVILPTSGWAPARKSAALLPDDEETINTYMLAISAKEA